MKKPRFIQRQNHPPPPDPPPEPPADFLRDPPLFFFRADLPEALAFVLEAF
jgi:hypothetical protein